MHGKDQTMGMALCVDDVPEATIHPMPSFKEFWTGLRERRLLLRKCSDCSTIFSPARVSCPKCLSTQLSWIRSKGQGTVYSFSTVYIAFDPVLNNIYCKNKLPFTFVLVEMEKGVMLSSNLIECSPSDVLIGMKVKMAFDAVRLSKKVPKLSRLKLPPFRPAR